MAKTRHNNLLDTINEIISDGSKKGVLHLYSEDEALTGRQFTINGKRLYHFGTTGYLGLEQDPRLKEAAIDSIRKYGTQFPLSKTYISYGIYRDLEDRLRQMYNLPVLITKNSTLGHIAVLPSMIRDEDAVILDHQVHASVQNAAQLLQPRGIPLKLIRHNDMNMLESMIQNLRSKHDKIWYMVDGVYSMFGDTTPIEHLKELCAKYPQLHIYVDDVHGMSWAGKNGTGWVMSQVKTLPEQFVLCGTLSKSFGANGALVVFPSEEAYKQVKTFGGPNTFSAQLDPASIGSAIASADIHLSEEIYEMQADLAARVSYCNSLLQETDLPLVERNTCPVFFIACGLPAVGYNFIGRLMKEGFYTNLALFPVVPVKNAGIRFTVSRHNHMSDIKGLVEAMEYHYPRALQEEDHDANAVRKVFKLPLLKEEADSAKPASLKLEVNMSFKNVNREEWDSIFKKAGLASYDGYRFMEQVFDKGPEPENDWTVYQLSVRDENGQLVAANAFTASLLKDDMLSPAAVSQQLEEERADDPYHMTTRVLSSGTPLTEGHHLYLDRQHPEWEKALKMLLDGLAEVQEKEEAGIIILRDFLQSDDELKSFLINQGFFKVDLPESSVIEDLDFPSEEDYISKLSYKSRRHVRTEVIPYQQYFDLKVKDQVSEEELDLFYTLYRSVSHMNLDLNLFTFPKRFFAAMNEDPNWEFVVLEFSNHPDIQKENLTGQTAAVVFTYKGSKDVYVPLLMGMDYKYMKEYRIYKQMLFQLVKRAAELGVKDVHFGFTASLEKKRVGATPVPKVAFVQAKENYKLEKLQLTVAKTAKPVK